MTANYLLPAGTINNRTAYFYADDTKQFGPIIKKIPDQILVILDYTTILAGHVIETFNFTSDAETNPPLFLTDPILNATGTVLSFLVSGGIDGQQYNIIIATEQVGSETPRDDILTINMPSKSACDASIPPVVSILAGSTIVATNIRYFWGPIPPTGQHVLDQWFDTNTNVLYEWATDGINYFWEEIGISSSTTTYITDAPSDDVLYSRRDANWVADPIQVDATSDGKIYVRNNGDWIPDPLQIDAPADGEVWGRQNNQWAVLLPSGGGGGIPEAPIDGNIYGRKNAGWTIVSGGGVTVTISDTPPIATAAGNLWWDSVGGQLYIWYVDGTSAQWVVVINRPGPPGPIGLTGPPGANSSVPGPAGPPGATYTLPIATSAVLGGVKPDGTTITVTGGGVISAVAGYTLPQASTTVLGGVKVDGSTVTINSGTGVISSTGLPLTGGVVQGPVDLKVQTVTQSGAALAINRTLGENCALSLTANITGVTVSNWPSAGTTGKVRLAIANTGAFNITGWPTGTIWPGGILPTITSGASKKDIILLMSDDGGVTIYGSVVGQDYH